MLKESSLNEISILIQRYPALIQIHTNLIKAVEQIAASCTEGGKILVCGNGGSAADSLHIVGELMKSFVLGRKIPAELQNKLRKHYPDLAEQYIENLQGAIPAISLVNEVSLMTAYSNDRQPDLVFAQQVLGYGHSGDILIAISTSGNSASVLHAARVARVMGIKVISLTGQTGGKLKEFSDILLAVPSQVTYQIQEYHLPVYHTICLALEKQIYDEY